MIRTGRCFCGEITFEFSAEPQTCVSCHCRDCQYVSGGHPTVGIVVPATSLEIMGFPKEYCSIADSGTEVRRAFCPTCGTPLFAKNAGHPDIVTIKLGSLDVPEEFAPTVHFWTSSAQPWHNLDPNVPQVERPNT